MPSRRRRAPRHRLSTQHLEAGQPRFGSPAAKLAASRAETQGGRDIIMRQDGRRALAVLPPHACTCQSGPARCWPARLARKGAREYISRTRACLDAPPSGVRPGEQRQERKRRRTLVCSVATARKARCTAAAWLGCRAALRAKIRGYRRAGTRRQSACGDKRAKGEESHVRRTTAHRREGDGMRRARRARVARVAARRMKPEKGQAYRLRDERASRLAMRRDEGRGAEARHVHIS